MASIKRGVNYLLHNQSQFIDSIIKNYFSWLPDKFYLSLRFRCQMGYWIDWKNPKTFSEKIQWLKLYNRKPEYTQMVDKFAVKDFVEKKIGQEYIIPTLGVWDKVESIEWSKLPNQFVMKTTHGGGGSGVIVCRDIENLDKDASSKILNSSLDVDIYLNLREWPYKNVKKRIIAEKYLEENFNENSELKDYKFFCFNGKVEFFKIDFNRFINHKANYFLPDGKILPFGEISCPPDFDVILDMPSKLNKMLSLASKLAEDLPFIRVDFYEVNGSIYFGEMTFYPASGMGRFTDEIWDLKIGDLLSIEN
ncbi:MAG: ATP-grasp fold amidoligase family protein [Bacteroidales bacterium]